LILTQTHPQSELDELVNTANDQGIESNQICYLPALSQ
jgi:hypothetical protein